MSTVMDGAMSHEGGHMDNEFFRDKKAAIRLALMVGNYGLNHVRDRLLHVIALTLLDIAMSLREIRKMKK